MENVKVTKNSIILKKKQSLADNASRTECQDTDPVALRGLIREELASRGLIDQDEYTPYYIKVELQYVVIRNEASQDYVTVSAMTGLVNSTCGAIMQLHYTQDSFDKLAGICAATANSTDTFFHNASELRWYLAHNLEYDVKCEDNRVIVSDYDGFLVLDGAGHCSQPYLVDADGQRVDIKGNYDKPGAWPAIKRFCRRLDYGKDYYLPYPIKLDDLLRTVKQTMAEHGPGWQPRYTSLLPCDDQES